MLKSLTFLLSISFFMVLNAGEISKDMCTKKGENYIFAGSECIEYRVYKGEIEDKLNIVVHGTWKEGTNILGRYAPFAENISFQTDMTTIAVALPGYSNSSTNHIKALKMGQKIYASDDYIKFLSQLIYGLKKKFKANDINYIGHSAGCSMGILLIQKEHNLINNILCAGGNFNQVTNLDKIDKNTNIVLVYGSKDKISKPQMSKDFYKLAKNKGLNIKIVEVKDAEHLDLDMRDTSVQAFIDLVEE